MMNVWLHTCLLEAQRSRRAELSCTPRCRSLASLSSWIVGRYGVPHSIAVYLALFSIAFVPTVLLPLRGECGKHVVLCVVKHERARATCRVQASLLAGQPQWPGCQMRQHSRHVKLSYKRFHPSAELGRRRGLSSQQEVAQDGVAGSGANGAALLLPGSRSSASSGDLDSRQHNGHAAELVIELLGAPSESKAGAGAAGCINQGDALVVRIGSKLAHTQVGGLSWEHGKGRKGGLCSSLVEMVMALTRAGKLARWHNSLVSGGTINAFEDALNNNAVSLFASMKGCDVMLRPLLTTADQDAEEQAATAAGATPTTQLPRPAAADEEEDSWSIAAVPSPRALSTAEPPPSPLAECLNSVPHIACPCGASPAAQSSGVPTQLPAATPCHSARSSAASTPAHPLGPSHGAATGSALARTASDATTAFLSGSSFASVPPGSSPSSAGGVPTSPRGYGGARMQPRSALLGQLRDMGPLASPTAARALVSGQQPPLIKEVG